MSRAILRKGRRGDLRLKLPNVVVERRPIGDGELYTLTILVHDNAGHSARGQKVVGRPRLVKSLLKIHHMVEF